MEFRQENLREPDTSDQLYHLIERNHLIVSYAEVMVGASGLTIYAAFSLLRYHLPDEQQPGAPYIDFLGHALTCALLVYIASHGLVSIRRSHLGYSFRLLASNVRSRISRIPGEQDLASDWFRNELEARVRSGLLAFGPILASAGRARPEQRIRTLQRIAGYWSAVYSDRVWGEVDEQWLQEHAKQLEADLRDFPEGLVGAVFETCDARVFYSLVLPITRDHGAGGRHRPINLSQFPVDHATADLLSGADHSSVASAASRQRDPPVLLVSAQAMSAGDADAPRPQSVAPPTAAATTPRTEEALDVQFAPILTSILHLTVILGRLARDGDLIMGLPDGSTILCESANRYGSYLLEWLGFELVQAAGSRAGAHLQREGIAPNVSVYQLVIGGDSFYHLRPRRRDC